MPKNKSCHNSCSTNNHRTCPHKHNKHRTAISRTAISLLFFMVIIVNQFYCVYRNSYSRSYAYTTANHQPRSQGFLTISHLYCPLILVADPCNIVILYNLSAIGQRGRCRVHLLCMSKENRKQHNEQTSKSHTKEIYLFRQQKTPHEAESL